MHKHDYEEKCLRMETVVERAMIYAMWRTPVIRLPFGVGQLDGCLDCCTTLRRLMGTVDYPDWALCQRSFRECIRSTARMLVRAKYDPDGLMDYVEHLRVWHISSRSR